MLIVYIAYMDVTLYFLNLLEEAFLLHLLTREQQQYRLFKLMQLH